jgi:hypothetical protein
MQSLGTCPWNGQMTRDPTEDGKKLLQKRHREAASQEWFGVDQDGCLVMVAKLLNDCLYDDVGQHYRIRITANQLLLLEESRTPTCASVQHSNPFRRDISRQG